MYDQIYSFISDCNVKRDVELLWHNIIFGNSGTKIALTFCNK